MKNKSLILSSSLLALAFSGALPSTAQTPDSPASQNPPRAEGAPPPGPARGGPGGPGGIAGPRRFSLMKQFDKDGDKKLNAAERKAAREFLEKEKAEGRGPRRPGPRGGRVGNPEPPPPAGPKLSPADVKAFPNAPLYDPQTVHTFFFEFESADWEKELADFYHTDAAVPAKLTVDGKSYRDVGVNFRGASSFFTVGEGRKRSFAISLDSVHGKQEIGGYRTLNLLNSHTDPTFLRTILYFRVAREYLPAPKANYARVVINGESWGAYVSAQQFNREFVKEWFGTEKGARWKVPGSPRGNGKLEYLGDDPAPYRTIYEIKTKDDPKAWADLVKLCKVLNQTPPDALEAALAPLFNIDGALKFLALENALINGDGYWIRTSDYHIYQDEKKRFHIIPHDANETFRAPGGPGAGGGQPINGVELDPLMGANDPNKPLLQKLLAAPALRSRYLGYIKDIAEQWLDWKKIGPMAEQYQSLIAADVKADTHKLYASDAFGKGVTQDIEEQGFRGPRQSVSLKNFIEQRRAFLLNHAEVRKAGSALKASP